MPQQLEKQRVDRRVERATRGPSESRRVNWKVEKARLLCMRAHLRLGVNIGIVREERRGSAFELPQGRDQGPRLRSRPGAHQQV